MLLCFGINYQGSKWRYFFFFKFSWDIWRGKDVTDGRERGEVYIMSVPKNIRYLQTLVNWSTMDQWSFI